MGHCQNAGAFSDELEELINDGFDECWMITSTGHVHCGFEIIADRRRQAIEGSADINPNLIQLPPISLSALVPRATECAWVSMKPSFSELIFPICSE